MGILGYFGEFVSGILVYHYPPQPPPPPRPTLCTGFIVVHSVTMQSNELIKKRRSFVRSSELADLPLYDGETMGDCCINAGSLESFVSNLKETQKQDVLDSSLLALKTQKLVQILRERHGKPWMGNSDSFSFNDYKTSHPSFSLSQVTLEILSTMVGGETRSWTW